jgi:hypothetical protein
MAEFVGDQRALVRSQRLAWEAYQIDPAVVPPEGASLRGIEGSGSLLPFRVGSLFVRRRGL